MTIQLPEPGKFLAFKIYNNVEIEGSFWVRLKLIILQQICFKVQKFNYFLTYLRYYGIVRR
jgi:hypothetical protein